MLEFQQKHKLLPFPVSLFLLHTTNELDMLGESILITKSYLNSDLEVMFSMF